MPARSGAEHHHSGPHLPNSPFTRPGPEDLTDPAAGEPVKRCLTCGQPDRSGSRLMEFALVYRGKDAGRYRLCERCWMHANPPPNADPLDVTEAA